MIATPFVVMAVELMVAFAVRSTIVFVTPFPVSHDPTLNHSFLSYARRSDLS